MSKKRLNTRQLEAFRATILLGGISKAADALGISQPATSRLIQDLSNEVGFPLFYRQGSGSAPTKNAEALFQEVDRLYVGIDELRSRAEAIGNGALGTLTIAAASIHANGLLPEIVAAFIKRHDKIPVTLESQSQEIIIDWVISNRCEIGFTNLPVQAPHLTTHRLAVRSAVCVMAADNPLAGNAVIDASDLNGRAFVSFPRDSPFRFRIDSVLERREVYPIITAEARTHEGVCGLVAEDVGVSVMSPFSRYVQDNPRLVVRPFSPAIPIEFGMIVDEKHMSTQARHFADFVLEWFKEGAGDRRASAGTAQDREHAAS